MTTHYVLNFYKFVELADALRLKAEHAAVAQKLGLLGTVVIAPEGINVALGSQNPKNLQDYMNFARADARFADCEVHESQGQTPPFAHLTVKLRDYIVIFPSPHQVSVDEIKRGKRLSPDEFEKLVNAQADDVVVLDTRNYFEVDYGAFQHAESLGIRKFRDFPQVFLEKYGARRNQTFLMYCTGGIRCEKAVAFAEKHGFKNVYQLDGGIMRYIRERGAGVFVGNNFVFDQRWAVGPDLAQTADGPHPDRSASLATAIANPDT